MQEIEMEYDTKLMNIKDQLGKATSANQNYLVLDQPVIPGFKQIFVCIDQLKTHMSQIRSHKADIHSKIESLLDRFITTLKDLYRSNIRGTQTYAFCKYI